MNKVFCVLPIYGKDDYAQLVECLDSINKLIIPNDTIFHLCIAVDGNLPKPIHDYIYSYKENTDMLCSIFHNPGLMGLAANINNVIETLKIKQGEFLMRMDADDVMDPLRLKKQLKFLLRNPDVDVVATMAERIDEAGNGLGIQGDKFGNVYPSKHWTNPIIHPSVLLRSEFFEKYGKYDEAFKFAQDWELWSRACKKGAKFYVLEDKLLKFRFVNASIKRRKKAQIYVIKLAFQNLQGWNLKCFVLCRSIIILIIPTLIIRFLLTLRTKHQNRMEDVF